MLSIFHLQRSNMKKLSITIIIGVFLFALLIGPVQSGIWDPFHTKNEKIALWKELWDTTSNTEYKSIGKT